MKFFLYCRKSTDREDRQILGTAAQRRLLVEHAGRHGFTIVDVFVENQTAYKTGRPLFNQMLGRLERREADGILTYHLTRLARNSFDGGRLIYMMDEQTVRQIATPEKAYTNNADDKFMMQIHFAMAKKSSDDTSQFVRRDVVSKLLRGEYPGMVPPGYLNINRDGHITRARDHPQKYLLLLQMGRPLRREEIDPIDGPLVRRLFQEAALGTRTLPALRKISYNLGLRTKAGTMLSKHAIWNLLTNSYYYGVIDYGGKLYTENIQHEPLIGKELFDQVQQALGRREKGRYRRHTFAFGGCVLRCGECGCPVTAERQKGHIYYHCTHNRGPCSQGWVREEVLAEQFARLLGNLCLPQSFLDYAFAKLRKSHARQVGYAAAFRRKLQTQAEELQRRLDSLLQLKLSPNNTNGTLLSDEEYLEQKRKFQEELHGTREQLASAGRQGETWVDDCEQFFAFTQKLAEKFTTVSVDEKRTLLVLLCSKLTLKDREVASEFKEPFASVAAFPLSAADAQRQFEPRRWRVEAEKPEIAVKWLGILDGIRTFWLTGAPKLPPRFLRS
jgi:DNA invertase Pin-like site-specific DNA recombinase